MISLEHKHQFMAISELIHRFFFSNNGIGNNHFYNYFSINFDYLFNLNNNYYILLFGSYNFIEYRQLIFL